MSTGPDLHGAQDRAIPDKPAVGRSLVDRIRERHESRNQTLDLPIPEWGGDVVVRYGRLAPKALQAAAKRKGARASNAELLVAACREVLIRDDDTGELVPAREADGQPGPIRFDGRLADLFAIQADTQRDIVIRMYADDIAVGAHAKRVFDWQTGADLDDVEAEEVEDDAGEADAAT